MKWNMNKWINSLLDAKAKKPLPILSFPATQLMGVSVNELIHDSDIYAEGMVQVAGITNSAAAVSLMDLSVEAECFGCDVRFEENEIPNVINSVISSETAARNIEVPDIGSGRTGIYLDALEKAASIISDRPVFSGVIGPYSLAGRLMGVTESMYLCMDEPQMVHCVLDKATEFIINYSKAYKEVGTNGIILAEPLAGVISPSMAEEFSSPYVKKIVEAVQDDSFIVIYHNCGKSASSMTNSIIKTGASVLHFGNAVDIKAILDKVPDNIPVLGNVDPAAQFRNGTPESVRKTTLDLLKSCGSYRNFIISSGCDIPPSSPWNNIEAFFNAVREYYA